MSEPEQPPVLQQPVESGGQPSSRQSADKPTPQPTPTYGAYAPQSQQPQAGQYVAPHPLDLYFPSGQPRGLKPAAKTITMKIWQFVLSLAGAAIAGIIVFILIVGLAASGIEAAKNDATAPATSDPSQSSKTKETPKPKSLTGITAEYSGSTADGTEINNSTEGIDVTATYDDGSTRDGISGFTVKNPGKLQAGQTQEFTVEFKGFEATFSVTADESDDQFKASAQDIPFDDLARNPDANKGKRVHFHGKIVQVIEGDIDTQYRVSVEQGDYGIWDSNKVIFVSYMRTGNDNRLLEDDIVDLWGTTDGTITYESTMGGNITIPSVSARIMQLAQ